MEPVLGDPEFVANEAAAIVHAAEVMTEAANSLSRWTDDGQHSRSTDSLTVNVQQLSYALGDAAERYGGTGSALATYAPVLRDAMTKVSAAISMLGHTDVGSAQHREETAKAEALATNANPFASEHDRHQALSDLQQAQQALQEQHQVANAAQTLYAEAIAELDTAANAAMGKIADAIEMSRLNDTFGDHVQALSNDLHKYLSNLLSVLHEFLSDLSDMLSELSAVILVIGILSGDPFLVTLAGALDAASTVVNLLDLGVQEGRFLIGDITFGELVSQALFTGASILLTAAGGGFAMKKLGKFLTTGGASEEGDRKALEFIFEGSLQLGDENGGGDFLSRLIDQHASVPPPLRQLQSMFPAHNDVGQLTPDFSSISVNRIVEGAGFASPIETNPLPVNTYVVNVA